ncbi:PREDICTED: fatty acid-binding protein homolog 6-like [Branchiostoma belcheri]|uniref:Fatty acid-binding protein homolog 6-like n=1 Tax=Branchiostoma belcheri TaxID=7741 RepID=A0A6P4ZWC5_BRABE|nr:PREDICTED: fatty acid-binding protein homolog 6-like [Branchiostoma belcheri]
MAASVVQFSGVWRHQHSQNLEAFMAALGIPPSMRTRSKDFEPKVDVKEHNEGWITWSTTANGKTTTNHFQLGSEFYEDTGDGKKRKVVYFWDNDRLVSVFKDWDGTGTRLTISRWIDGHNVVAEVNFRDVTLKRVYRKS